MKVKSRLLRSHEELELLVEERTAELAAANKALLRKEEHFRQLFTTIPLPVWLCSEATHQFLEVNEAAVAHYGYTREEFLRMTLEDIRPPEYVEQLHKDLASIGSEGTLIRGRKHRVRDGRLINVEISASRVNFTGVPSFLLATHDVTENLRMEVELRHGQKLQAVGELAAGIAHEINTPIQFVGDNVQFLQGAFADLIGLLEKHEQVYEAMQNHCDAQQTGQIKAVREIADLPFLRREIPPALTQAVEGVTRVTTIVQALRKFSHVDWGPEKNTANLNEALESTLVVAGSELKYVADVVTEFGDLPPVKCYIGDLNQVFLNLLVNAAHAIGDVVKSTGHRGQIRVETRTEEDWAVVAIGDSGTGIPAEIRNRIFDPFFTTKGVGKGTGQGLALARAIIVERHGGALTFDSEIGKGTTFYIRIPINPPDKTDALTEDETSVEVTKS
jgi:two-component system NtrC family sensor kinase